MPPKKEPYFYDPIAAAAQAKEREEYLAGLFQPIFLHLDQKPIEWLVPGLIPKGYLVFLAAEPKAGKTCLATALALAVATGTPFAGMPTQGAPVLWLSMEESRYERRLILQQSELADPATPLYTCYEQICVDTQAGIEDLLHWVQQTEAGLLVVDPLHGAHSGRSLQDSSSARKCVKLLKWLCGATQVSTLVLHHSKRPGARQGRRRVADSDQLAATASMDIVLSSRELIGSELESADGGSPEAAHRLLTLNCRGRGEFANRTLHLLSRGPLDYRALEDRQIEQMEQKNRPWIESDLLELLTAKTQNSGAMMAKLKVDEFALRHALTTLRRQGLVRITWSNRHTRRYGLTQKGQEIAQQEKKDKLVGPPRSN